MYLWDMKRILHLSGLIIILLSIACMNASVPEGILGEDVMKDILSDVHLTIALTQKPGRSLDQRTADREEIINSILVRHNIDRPTFFQSYDFYMQNPVLLDSIYSRVIRDMDQWQLEEQLIERDMQLDFQRQRNRKRDSMQSKPPTFQKP